MKAKKSLSQNFLVDEKAAKAVVEAIPLRGKEVLEIGAGTGALTARLAERAKRVTAIEKDHSLAEGLRRLMSSRENVEVIQGDVLESDLSGYGTIIGSIPYHISSPILFKILNSDFSEAVLVLQKEFALRLVAGPNTSDWSRLSAMAQSLADIELAGEIPRGCFTPKPKVDSSIVVLRANKKFVLNEKLVAALFQHKNQSVRNAVKHSVKALGYSKEVFEAFLDSAGGFAGRKVRSLTLNELRELSEKAPGP
jgi:16S rRNA (adenine1518-N6/adenine1519-N6)-dimethyltransferase